MALHGERLFVVDGPRVWRTEPGQAQMEARLGKPRRWRGREFVQMITLSPDGVALSVAVQDAGGFTRLAGVCLQPCK